jgi:V8-like Glu-specific endopeptidase
MCTYERNIWGHILVLLTLILVFLPIHAEAQVLREALTKDMDILASEFSNRGDGVYWEKVISMPGSKYLRLGFQIDTLPNDKDFEILIVTQAGTQLARYSGKSIAQGEPFLTDLLFSSSIKVQVRSARQPAGLMFKINQLTYQVDVLGRLRPESIPPNWVSPSRLEAPPPPEVLEPIAKLYIGQGYVCTGFLVSKNLLLTNNHCLEKSTSFSRLPQGNDCSDIEIQFDFNLQGALEKTTRTRCLRVRGNDPILDYALLQLDPNNIKVSGIERRWLKFKDAALSNPAKVVIIHHPAGLAKKISYNCDLYPRTENDLEHNCATASGSSGAPVLNDQWEVIGLHYKGAFNENLTMADIERMLADGEEFFNKAKPVSAISSFTKTIRN